VSKVHVYSSKEDRRLASFVLEEDESVLRCLHRHKMMTRSSCFGGGECGDCLMTVLEGAEHLPDQGLREKRTMRILGKPQDGRLACMVVPTQDVSVKVPGF